MKQKSLLMSAVLICGLFSLSPAFSESSSAAAPTPAASPADGSQTPSADSQDVDITEKEDEQLTIEQEETNEAAQEVKKTNSYWSAPDFSKQDASIGWTPTTFEIPPGFQRRVNFWIDVYTKYTTHQVLLHDAQYLDIVYKILDLTPIENDKTLDGWQKEKAKKKYIKEEKKKIHDQLLRIQVSAETPSKLSADDLAVYKKFRFVFEKNKFKKAAERNRLRMQLGQKDRFQLGVYFSGRYIREMEKIFREEKVPVELTRLPFVESSFNLYAYSKVGASGIWQFMRSTGRLFHLKLDSITDRRNDPLEATRAAAKLLRFNYQLLGSWPLALTAYNHGPRGVSLLVKKLRTDDINEIVWNSTRRRFGFASENFYAEFLAALEVESHAAKYFGKLQVSPPLVYDEVKLPKPATFGEIVQAMRVNSTEDGYDRARLFNPFFTRAVYSGRRKIAEDFSIRIPHGFTEKFLSQLATVDPVKARLEVKSGLYKILPGDTLSTISRDLGISVKELREVNNLSPRAVLRPGQRLVVPTAENR
jgi:membrane-bound lytic murein transglycosylase D